MVEISKPGYIKQISVQIYNIVAVHQANDSYTVYIVCEEMHVGPLMGDYMTLQ